MADLTKLSEADLKAIATGDMQSVSEEGLRSLSGTEEPGLISKGLDLAGRGLDYAGGITRAGLATAASPLVDGLSQEGDFSKALKGQAPTTAQYMERAGVPEAALSEALPGLYSPTGEEWLKIKKGGLLDPTARGVGGFIGDVALDPLTYLSAGVSGAAKAGRAAKIAMNPVPEALQAAGRGMYASGMKNIDTRVIEKGGDAVSPYLRESGVWWNPEKGIQAGMDRLAPKRASMYEEMTRAGQTIDPNKAVEPALDYLTQLEKKRLYGKEVGEGLDQLGQLTKGGPMDAALASDIKSSLYQKLPPSFYDPLSGAVRSEGKDLAAKMSGGLKAELERAAEATRPGMGEELGALNREWGAYLSAQKPAVKEAAKEARKNLLTQVKAGALVVKPEVAAAMYGAQALGSAPVRMGAGLLSEKAGKKIPQGVWNRLLVDIEREQNK